MKKINILYKIKKNSYLLLASLLTVFITFGLFYSLGINEVSAATKNICTGNYYPSPYSALRSNQRDSQNLNFKGSLFNYSIGTQYDENNNIITCNSYKNDRNRESVRDDSFGWYQWDCNGSWLGGVKWVKQQYVGVDFAPPYTRSCLNVSQNSCSSTEGCSVTSSSTAGSCSGSASLSSEFKEIVNLSDQGSDTCYGGRYEGATYTCAAVDTVVRHQEFAVNSVVPGDVFRLMVYSHLVSVTANSYDTPDSIAQKMVYAINATTTSQWNDHSSFPYTAKAYTDTDSYIKYPTKPYAKYISPGIVYVRLDKDHSFAHGVIRSCSNIDNETQCNLYSSCTWTPSNPTVNITINNSNNPTAVSPGSTVTVRWTSTNAKTCTVSASDGSVDDQGTSGSFPAVINSKTTFTATCSN